MLKDCELVKNMSHCFILHASSQYIVFFGQADFKPTCSGFCMCVFTHQGKSEYVGLISEELETHATVYQPPGHSSNLPSFIRNHGLLTQERFLQLLRRAKVRALLGMKHQHLVHLLCVVSPCLELVTDPN